MKNKTRTFVFKNEMVEWIADYYAGIWQGLDEKEYEALEKIYYPAEEVIKAGLEKTLIGECRDFDIYRCANGDWLIKIVA